jgi:hypothetical protein
LPCADPARLSWRDRASAEFSAPLLETDRPVRS